MSDVARPSEGARFLLAREREEGARAVYRVEIATPEATYVGRATLCDDGTVELAATGAPAEHEGTVAQIAKLVARGARKRRDDGLPAWPERVQRWRGPGRGSTVE